MFIGFSLHIYAQKVSGTIADKTTGLPVGGALVISSASRTASGNDGKFEIAVSGFTDTIKIVYIGYKTYLLPMSKIIYPVRIALEPAVISLKQVSINAARDYRRDSLLNRKLFEREFNYTGPKVKDMFLPNMGKGPGEILSVDPLLLLAILTKKKSAEYKLHQDVVLDEQAAFVNRKFSRTLVGQTTGLKGDTLNAFLSQYRPSYQFLQKASEYDLLIYIKDSLKKFRQQGITQINPFDTTLYKNHH
ncbi:hypothetical protein [uncultured Mucilaginibacter sp.]|uniref:hypothetical protein n=1 Tax=uncultured Mucilaginibacter sp. TaxID=797541 RepID=UPI0025CD8070|nr:hypothetical protein [uncultured Mucilaginibacter sp.]